MDNQDETLKITAELWNSFLNIPQEEKHPDDTNDFRHHIHALQNILYTQKYKKYSDNNNIIENTKHVRETPERDTSI